MAEYRTTFPISASPDRVWEVLVDFDRWSEWNPSVPSIRGEARAGSQVAMTLAMPSRPSAKVKATLTDVVSHRRLCWQGHVGSERLFAGRREFELAPQPDGTVLLTHVERVTGLLSPVFRALMGPAIQQHHDNLNSALKQRAEGQPTQG